LRNAEHLLNKYQGQADLLQTEIARKQGELQYWSDLCDFQDQLHKAHEEKRNQVLMMARDAEDSAEESSE